MRSRAGSVVRRKGRNKGEKASWWARITYTDPVTGKRHNRQRRAESKVHAKELIHSLLAEVDSTGGRSLESERMTFLYLATYFEKHYLKPAEYISNDQVDLADHSQPHTFFISPFRATSGFTLRLRPLVAADNPLMFNPAWSPDGNETRLSHELW